MQNLHVASCIYHLNLLRMVLGLLHRNSIVWVLLVVVCVTVETRHNSYLGLLELSLLNHLRLIRLREGLNNGLSTINGLVRWNLALVTLTIANGFGSEFLLTHSWLIEHKVLILSGRWTNRLLILKVGTLVKRRLVVDWFIEPVDVVALVQLNLSTLGYKFGKLLHMLVQVVVGNLLVVITLRKLSLGHGLLELLVWLIAPNIL